MLVRKILILQYNYLHIDIIKSCKNNIFFFFFSFFFFFFSNLFINTKLHLQIKILQKRKVYTTASYLWYFYKIRVDISIYQATKKEKKNVFTIFIYFSSHYSL